MDLKDIETRLQEVLITDRQRLRRRLRQLTRQSSDMPVADDRWQAWMDELTAATERSTRRRADRPQVDYPQDLPITQHVDVIKQALREHQVVVVAGETGSGKSTQLPKICLEAGWGDRGVIGHTQPRRIAARTIASRVSEELKVALGQQVGFKVRFHDRTDARTYIKLMTDGVLLAETQSDRYLNQYQTIILDEAHERSLNIDFLLGYLKDLLPRRGDLRLVITSATIDAARFAEHFRDERGPAPVVEVSGRGYPVEILYRPLEAEDGDDLDVADGVSRALEYLAGLGPGHVLVFLPTERDIREMARVLRRKTFARDNQSAEVLPLYARLSAAEQNKIFQSSARRRIVLATNVAESSLTVPDIRYVVDTGTARISRYSPRSKILRLPIEAISRASSDQRAGRCGRVAPGVCIRLYDQEDYESRDAYTTPEIRRTNLAAVILQAKSLHLQDIDAFPFLDPPRPEAIRDGYKTLFEIQAIDRHRNLTETGKRLARMPVDPRIGRMILAGADENCLHEVLIIASALEIQDPRERPHDKQQQADERQEAFLHPESDFLGFLKLWDFFHHLKETLSRSQIRKACEHNFLSFNRMREWTEVHRQLLDVASQQGLKQGPRRDEFTPIHRALLTGLLSGVAYKSSDYEYTGGGGITMRLWPGSGLFRERPAWIMAADRVETSQRFARTVARISPTWVEASAQHLVKRSFSDPHWSKKARAVMAYEKVSLMGMPIVARRRVPYGTIDPETSRRLFIEGALVEGRVDDFDRVVQQNRELRAELENLAAKTRRREFLIDDYSIFRFYDHRLPEDVCDVAGMRRWLKRDQNARETMTMKVDDFVESHDTEQAVEQFPSRLNVDSLELPAHYHFSPGDDDDGVTLTVPVEALNQLDKDRLSWLVPGLLEEKVVALIRSLPKSLRRNFVPVPDTARAVIKLLDASQGSLTTSLASALSQYAAEVVRADDFDLAKLPPHLIMNLRVVDAEGETLQMARDLEQIRQTVLKDVSHHEPGLTSGDEAWRRDGITEWDFGDLPESVPLQRGGVEIAGFPAVVDQGSQVGLRLFDTKSLAEDNSRRGICRLYMIASRKSLKTQIRWLPQWQEVCVWAASVVDAETMKEQIQYRIAELAFLGRKKPPRTESEFKERLEDRVERIAVATQQVAPLLPKLFSAYHQARLALESVTSPRFAAPYQDLKSQLDALMEPEFLSRVPWNWLQQYPRYLEGIRYRIEKLEAGGLPRDDDSRELVQQYWQRYVQKHAANQQTQQVDAELVEFRWMIEELRISLFAQPLGTMIKVSPQRLDKQWQKVS